MRTRGRGTRWSPATHARRCYVAAETATRRGDKGEGRRPWGSQGEVKGIPGSVVARGIGAKGADGGGLRRRPSPAERRGNLAGATGVRFKGVGASLGLRDPVCGVGWGGRAPRRAGDKRRPPGAGGNGGEAMPGGGGSRGGVYACSGVPPSYHAD
uniref:DUF591 domain-containing protein n=1 Tax=Oryza sativa subsp. japonica TaxID=39947 RepID=Q8LH01_ORYSJ|nr:hypothetical protein [Oryza sativa Japonica Group]